MFNIIKVLEKIKKNTSSTSLVHFTIICFEINADLSLTKAMNNRHYWATLVMGGNLLVLHLERETRGFKGKIFDY